MVRNAWKRQFGPNGEDQVHSLRKILTQLGGTNFCTSSARFAPSFMQLRNNPKCTQTLWNAPKHKFRVQWDGSSVFVAKKLQREFVARTFALIAPVHPVSHWISGSYETIRNAPKHYETHKNMSLGSNGEDRVRSLQQILTRLHGTKFCINCTSSECFAPCFMQLRNHPKWTQTLCNSQKHEFRFQWRGSSAVVAKHYHVTSWHKLLH